MPAWQGKQKAKAMQGSSAHVFDLFVFYKVALRINHDIIVLGLFPAALQYLEMQGAAVVAIQIPELQVGSNIRK